MPKLMESISVLNSTIRTLLAAALAGAVSFAAWFGYSEYNASQRQAAALADAEHQLRQQSELLAEKEQEIGALNRTVAEQLDEIDRLSTAVRLLKVDHRVAQLSVLEQTKDPDSAATSSLIEFQELNSEGNPIGQAKQFRIQGDIVYIDSWIAKFDDKYVEQADPLRATSLVLFRRIFGEQQQPAAGFALDKAGARPQAYAQGDEMSRFEEQIWDDFWSVANDSAKQAELGIRAAHGEAPSIQVQKGKAYRVMLRASDGLTVVPAGDIPVPERPAA